VPTIEFDTDDLATVVDVIKESRKNRK
jgi:hypothetical protein